jgi:DNA-binding NarL/FixJ family response regulator
VIRVLLADDQQLVRAGFLVLLEASGEGRGTCWSCARLLAGYVKRLSAAGNQPGRAMPARSCGSPL